MNKLLHHVAGGLVGLALLAGTNSLGAVTLTVESSADSIEIGAQVDVGIIASALGDASAPSIGIFDLNIGFDPTVLQFGSVSFGEQLDLFDFGSSQSASLATLDQVNLFELSLDSAQDLNDQQLDSFALATITFIGLAPGTSEIVINIAALGDAVGDTLAATIENASTTVVPVGPALPFLACALAAMLATRRLTST